MPFGAAARSPFASAPAPVDGSLDPHPSGLYFSSWLCVAGLGEQQRVGGAVAAVLLVCCWVYFYGTNDLQSNSNGATGFVWLPHMCAHDHTRTRATALLVAVYLYVIDIKEETPETDQQHGSNRAETASLISRNPLKPINKAGIPA